MRAIDRKLVREVWRLRGQMISIAVVVAAGVMTVVTMRGTYQSLQGALDRYYRDYRFAHVWSGLKRAPESVRWRIGQIPGVAAVETRVTFAATLDVPRLDAPALGRFVSIPDRRRSMLNDIHITGGRYVAPGRSDEAIVSKNFAIANDLVPGDTLRALINGRLRSLRVVGLAISPEHSYAVPPGALFPDDERYGVIWMSRRVLGPAYDMDGAFNEVVVSVGPGADAAAVESRLDQILEPYGGVGAYGRDQQLSAKILGDEINGNRLMGTLVPAVFLAVAAFLLHLVLSRLITTQRTEIAVLKAFGYRDTEIGWHYLRFALVAVLAGAVFGTGLGLWLGQTMLTMYGTFFDFPSLRYELSWALVGIGAGVSIVAAVLGALGAVRRAVRLPPAEAMRPAPPARFRPGWLERAGVGRVLPAAGRMILRNIEREPVKAALSAVGVAFSVAILVIGMFMFDGTTLMLDLQFRVGQREDLAITFNQPLASSARYDLAHFNGVTRVEPFRSLPVRLSSGHRAVDVGITGVAEETRLRRIVTARGGVQPLPPEGIVISDMLATELRVSAGDSVVVKVLEGRRRTGRTLVSGVVEDFLGLAAYMDLEALYRLAGERPVISGAYLKVDPDLRPALYTELKRLPVVASVASPAQMLASFEDYLGAGLFIGIGFLLGFSAIIAVAVVYNGARIALSERGRELASLRVLGFTRGEVSVLLLGEQAIVTAVAIPLGWGLGYLLAALVAAGLRSETYRIPLLVSEATFLWSALIVGLAAVLSGGLVRRRLNRLDLVAVLKTRE